MSLSVKENRVVAVNRVGENTLQTVLQGKVELPSTAAPVGRIVWVKGVPAVQSLALDQDRVYVQGAIDLTMVYVPETLEDEPAGLQRVDWPGALPFDTHVEVIGAAPEMVPTVQAAILACEWELAPGQYALDVDLIVAVTAAVEQIQEYTVISDANLAKPVKLSTDGLVLNPLTPPLELQVEKQITGMLDFDPEENAVKTILDLEPQLVWEEPILSDGKLELKGWAGLEVLLEAADRTVKLQNFTQALPLELSWDEPELGPGTVVHPQLEASCAGFVVNEGRNIRVELSLKGMVQAVKPQPIQVLTEISAPGSQVEVRTEPITLDSFVTRKEQQGVFRGLVELGQDLPPMREVLKSRAVAHLTDYEVEQDKLVVEGVVDLEIFYLAHSEEDTKPLFRAYFPEVMPFSQTLAVPGLEVGMQPRITVEAAAVRPDLINRETLEAAVTLRFKGDVVEYLEVEVAVEAVEVEPPEEDPPTLTFVFAQSGDTVWKLARRYHTTEDALLEANPSLDQSAPLKPGEQIFIPR